ncbi:UvrD-helicase domain-containing protein [Actinoplanes couchii]|uniref:RecBCD enzyme subunit RecB n=1 Tax=Actinoplanes couchii TaxID=403638 RepID=A0ABQ3X8P8_9ACTN|nr:UvrD-helicase domain-containing protein [Actinoplanes couchii]MDR6320118.1 exodeoxyribonuclease V beta subunit [Actinoplanes couchii]GID54867.1 RecBCD enzyme subunit RecB [Actinoplanes couchii]
MPSATLVVTGFDIRGPLPEGTTVLEASAGTGKTWTIAALATRYVAEGRAALDQLLLVTFGRSATAELRQRVRERLVATERALADPHHARVSPDPLVALLADVSPDEVARRRQRLVTAVAGFDAATIATTHQFCRQVLADLGITADTDPATVFTEDLDDLVTEVADDLYLRKYGTAGSPGPHFDRKVALAVARQAVTDGQARLEPSTGDPDAEAQVRCRFATAVRAEVGRRQRARGLTGFDDLLTGLATTLTDPARGPDACRRLRERYSVVMIDEFQDTDPVQWTIVRTAFHGHRTLVLIGDPKQAIYAFRGADVVSYLAAAADAPAHAGLATNWRSDHGLLAAFATVFGRAALGDSRITVRPVDAAHPDARLPGPPFRLRVLGRNGFPLNKIGLVAAADARDAIVADLVSQVTVMLAGREVVPGDVAVLVRTNRQSTLVHQALASAGVPAVQAGTTSVFGTPAARDWLALLDGLDQPHRRARVAAAALTGLVGWPARKLAEATETDLDRLGTTLRHWAVLAAEHGMAALLEAVTATGLPERLLARRGGERRLTDLRHIGTALHAAAVDGDLGLAAVTDWLRRRIDDAPLDASVERSRRLESDADAVQILTVHGSKGLEYPVVLLPFGWDRFVGQPDLLRLHDAAGQRVLDVGGPSGAGFRASERRHRDEEDGEDLRLLYVALTRAASRVVAWWAPTANTRASALHRFLFGRPGAGENPLPEYPVPADDDALSHLRGLGLEIERVEAAEPARWEAPVPARPELAVAHFRRRLDLDWRRTSYSRLTSGQHDHPAVDSENPTAQLDDEAAVPVVADPGGPGSEVLSPMGELPAGAAFGTLLHSLLERCDFTAPDLTAELVACAAGLPLSGLDPRTLADALVPALRTPLGPLADGRSLTGFGRGDRLDELEFEFPLGGGDRAPDVPEQALESFSDCVARHLRPGDPLSGYVSRLRELGPLTLRGYLTGSIDAVLRLPGPRYVVVDYKSNRLGGFSAPLTAADYRPAAMSEAMIAAHYPLQALLYGVALHRYLRWRQPGYDPSTHFGGVLYLFLRGMCGPATPPGHGVFSWQPPHELITELSDLL